MRSPRSARDPRPAAQAQDGRLTTVEVTFVESKIEHRIRFGRAVRTRIIDSLRRVISFAPDNVFGFVRWVSNDYGTVISRIDVVRAVAPGEAYQTVPFVRPGGDILLSANGWPKVERVLQLVDAIEALGIDAAESAPDYWRHVHNRLVAAETPRTYTRGQHRAFLLRRRATP